MRTIFGGVVSRTVTLVEQLVGADWPFDAERTIKCSPDPKFAAKVRLDAVSVPPDGISFVWYAMPSTFQTTCKGFAVASSTSARTSPSAAPFVHSRISGPEQLIA